MTDATLKRWHDMMAQGPEEAGKATRELISAQSNKRLPPAVMDPKFAKSYWEQNTAIMEAHPAASAEAGATVGPDPGTVAAEPDQPPTSPQLPL